MLSFVYLWNQYWNRPSELRLWFPLTASPSLVAPRPARALHPLQLSDKAVVRAVYMMEPFSSLKWSLPSHCRWNKIPLMSLMIYVRINIFVCCLFFTQPIVWQYVCHGCVLLSAHHWFAQGKAAVTRNRPLTWLCVKSATTGLLSLCWTWVAIDESVDTCKI